MKVCNTTNKNGFAVRGLRSLVLKMEIRAVDSRVGNASSQSVDSAAVASEVSVGVTPDADPLPLTPVLTKNWENLLAIDNLEYQ